jgi:hypothetical protein
VKARRVKGLDPNGPLADNAARIVAVRLAELCSFVPRALDPAQVEALHDMRIAAKRLRYVLELTGDTCFGTYAETGIRRTRELQDLLGEIHDCDVTLPRVLALIGRRRELAALEARAAAGDAEDLDPALAAQVTQAGEWRGLEVLATHLRARRALLFERFLELWRDLEREGFRARLRYAISERPGGRTPLSSSDNGDHPSGAVASPAGSDG